MVTDQPTDVADSPFQFSLTPNRKSVTGHKISYLYDCRLQPFNPLVSRPSGADVVIRNAVEDSSRADMYTNEPSHL